MESRTPRYALGCTVISLVLFGLVVSALFGLERFAGLSTWQAALFWACALLPLAVFFASTGLLLHLCARDLWRLGAARTARSPAPEAARGVAALAAASATAGLLSVLGLLLFALGWLEDQRQALGMLEIAAGILLLTAAATMLAMWRSNRRFLAGYRALASCMRGQPADWRARSALGLCVLLIATGCAWLVLAALQFQQNLSGSIDFAMLSACLVGAHLAVVGAGCASLGLVIVRTRPVLAALLVRERWLLAGASSEAPPLPDITVLTTPVRLFGLLAWGGAASAALNAGVLYGLAEVFLNLQQQSWLRVSERADWLLFWGLCAGGWLAGATLLRGLRNTLVALASAQEGLARDTEGVPPQVAAEAWSRPERSSRLFRFSLAGALLLILAGTGLLELDRPRSQLAAWLVTHDLIGEPWVVADMLNRKGANPVGLALLQDAAVTSPRHAALLRNACGVALFLLDAAERWSILAASGPALQGFLVQGMAGSGYLHMMSRPTRETEDSRLGFLRLFAEQLKDTALRPFLLGRFDRYLRVDPPLTLRSLRSLVCEDGMGEALLPLLAAAGDSSAMQTMLVEGDSLDLESVLEISLPIKELEAAWNSQVHRWLQNERDPARMRTVVPILQQWWTFANNLKELPADSLAPAVEAKLRSLLDDAADGSGAP